MDSTKHSHDVMLAISNMVHLYLKVETTFIIIIIIIIRSP
jgi:hypothetical protein